MARYVIKKSLKALPLNGDVKGPWALANVLEIDDFPWYKGGAMQATDVRLLYTDSALYVQFICQDKHISAKNTEFNGPVCLDSCVEFFATIEPQKRPDYFNLEINCCGQFHMGFGPERKGRTLMPVEMSGRIKVVTSIDGDSKEESALDEGWWAAVEIPFDLIGEFASIKNPGTKVAPATGAKWKANFYRCGGKTDDQYGVWNEFDWPQPDFHRPEFFGELVFG